METTYQHRLSFSCFDKSKATANTFPNQSTEALCPPLAGCVCTKTSREQNRTPGFTTIIGAGAGAPGCWIIATCLWTLAAAMKPS
eukprot:625711-Amphidinium_carterae.1